MGVIAVLMIFSPFILVMLHEMWMWFAETLAAKKQQVKTDPNSIEWLDKAKELRELAETFDNDISLLQMAEEAEQHVAEHVSRLNKPGVRASKGEFNRYRTLLEKPEQFIGDDGFGLVRVAPVVPPKGGGGVAKAKTREIKNFDGESTFIAGPPPNWDASAKLTALFVADPGSLWLIPEDYDSRKGDDTIEARIFDDLVVLIDRMECKKSRDWYTRLISKALDKPTEWERIKALEKLNVEMEKVVDTLNGCEVQELRNWGGEMIRIDTTPDFSALHQRLDNEMKTERQRVAKEILNTPEVSASLKNRARQTLKESQRMERH